MSRYEYVNEMSAAIRDYIADSVNLADYADRDELEQALNDDLFVNDAVTGNASGSYYCNAYRAAEAISGALDTLVEALEEFGDDPESYKKALLSPEYADVTIRCYLLGEAIGEALDMMETAGELEFSEDDDTDETGEEYEEDTDRAEIMTA